MTSRRAKYILIILLLAVGAYFAARCYFGSEERNSGLHKNTAVREKIEGIIEQAEVLIDQDNLEKAYKVLEKASSLTELDAKNKSYIWILEGRTFLFRNKPEKALPYYFKALEYSKSIKDSAQIGAAFYDIACVFNIVKDYDRAVSFADSVTVYNKSIEKRVSIAGLKTNIYSLSNRYSKAIKSGDQAIKLMGNSDEYGTNKMVILSIIAESYLNLKQPDKGQPYLDKAILFEHFDQFPYDKAEIDITRAGYAISRKSYKEAIGIINYLLADDIKENIKHMLSARIYKRLSDAYAGLGDFKKAYEFEDKATKEFLNLKKEADFYAVARKDAEHYLSEKDNVIAKDKFNMLEQDKRLQSRTIISIVLGLLIFFLGAVIWLVRVNYNNKNKLYEERLKTQESLQIQKEQESNLALIEAGIQGEERERERIAQELHDSVAGELMVMKLNLKSLEKQGLYTGKNQLYYQLIEQTGEIADKIRTTAHNLMPTKLSRKGLFESIKSFLEAIQADDIKFKGQFYGTLPKVKKQVEKIIFFVILELIQNIIKHSEAKSALVQLSCDDELLSITVEDTGIGCVNYNENAKNGLGIKKIKEQLDVLGGTIDIRSQRGVGTTIFIEIPLQGFLLDASKGDSKIDQLGLA